MTKSLISIFRFIKFPHPFLLLSWQVGSASNQAPSPFSGIVVWPIRSSLDLYFPGYTFEIGTHGLNRLRISALLNSTKLPGDVEVFRLLLIRVNENFQGRVTFDALKIAKTVRSEILPACCTIMSHHRSCIHFLGINSLTLCLAGPKLSRAHPSRYFRSTAKVRAMQSLCCLAEAYAILIQTILYLFPQCSLSKFLTFLIYFPFGSDTVFMTIGYILINGFWEMGLI